MRSEKFPFGPTLENKLLSGNFINPEYQLVLPSSFHDFILFTVINKLVLEDCNFLPFNFLFRTMHAQIILILLPGRHQDTEWTHQPKMCIHTQQKLHTHTTKTAYTPHKSAYTPHMILHTHHTYFLPGWRAIYTCGRGLISLR